MNKSQLIDSVAGKANITKKDAEKVLSALVETVGATLQSGDKVQIMGFGTFETRQRSARTGRNPQTGQAINIPATTVPAFKPGKELKDIVK